MAYHQMRNCSQMIHLYFRKSTMLILLQVNEIMIRIKSINGLSNGKWVLTQTQANRPKKLFFVEKLRKFFILRYVNNSIASQTPYQKHLGIFLDARLTFEEHLKVITTKININIGLLPKLQKTLPRPALMTMYKAFVGPHLDYNLWWSL